MISWYYQTSIRHLRNKGEVKLISLNPDKLLLFKTFCSTFVPLTIDYERLSPVNNTFDLADLIFTGKPQIYRRLRFTGSRYGDSRIIQFDMLSVM